METILQLTIDIPNRLVVIENGDNQYPIFIPQHGDILYGKSRNCDESDMIDIIEWYGKDTHSSYLSFDISNDRVFPGDIEIPHDSYSYVLATEDQKQLLFDRLKRDGKQWNHEKMTVEFIHDQLRETIENVLREFITNLLENLK